MTASIILPPNLLLDGERHAPLHPGADGAGDGEVEHQRQVGRPAPLRRPEHGARVQPRVRTLVHRGQQDRGHPNNGHLLELSNRSVETPSPLSIVYELCDNFAKFR